MRDIVQYEFKKIELGVHLKVNMLLTGMPKQNLSNNYVKSILLSDGWLSRQPSDFQNDLINRSHLQHYKSGDYIYHLGDPPGGIFGLVQGSLLVTGAAGVGIPRLLQIANPGTWFGIGGYINRAPRRLDLKAHQPTWMLHLPLVQMDQMTSVDPSVMRNFTQILMGSIDRLIRIISDLQETDVARRVAATIERSAPADSDEMRVTQTEIGEMACATRRQVHLVLRDFAERGWVRVCYGRIILTDLEAIRHFRDSE